MMNEGMLSPESRDLLDDRMEELKKLMLSEDHEDLPAYREAIVTLSLMGNVCFTEVADILYYLLSAGFHGWSVLPTLKAIMEASAKAGITARRAFNALSIFIGAGFVLSEDTLAAVHMLAQIPAAYPAAFGKPPSWQEHPDPEPEPPPRSPEQNKLLAGLAGIEDQIGKCHFLDVHFRAFQLANESWQEHIRQNAIGGSRQANSPAGAVMEDTDRHRL